ncbi:MAG: glycosyltransferase family 39 protein [Proteobacteria bacterium]|nr:glycosyltransferase family 39 protein [Pseudomonadota bacterium]
MTRDLPPSPRLPPTPRGLDYLLALALLVGSFAALGLAQRTVGVTRDEGTYFEAARSYWSWIDTLADGLAKGTQRESLTTGAITRHWSVNREHPPLFKTLFGISHHMLHERPWRQPWPPRSAHAQGPGLLPAIDAFRLPTWLIAGAAVALLYLFGLRLHGRTAGLSAALLYLTLPRLFFHGQLACFDAGIATLWLLVVYAYFRSLDHAGWGFLAGPLLGLALAGKHNAWFLPPLLLAHYLVVVRPDVSLRPLVLPRLPLAFVSMALLAPAVFVGLWPWLWFEPLAHLREYVAFHLHHAYYNIEYLGRNLARPPLPVSYPFVMTLVTVPAVTLALASGGAALGLRPWVASLLGRWGRRRGGAPADPYRFPARRSWLRPASGLNPRSGLLLALNALFPLLLIALPSTPKFGGTKHWLPAYPFLALFAGIALGELSRALRRDYPALRPLAWALPLLVAIPGALNLAQTHPFGLSQYTALAGGVPGAADLGLNRQFWGYAPRALLPTLNERLPPQSRMYFHDVSSDAHAAYVQAGLLRSDIQYAGMELPAIEASDHALVIHELHFNKYDYWIWEAYGTPAPTEVLALDGVPLVSVYERRRNDRADAPTDLTAR